MYLFVFTYLFIYLDYNHHGNCLCDSAQVLQKKKDFKGTDGDRK